MLYWPMHLVIQRNQGFGRTLYAGKGLQQESPEAIPCWTPSLSRAHAALSAGRAPSLLPTQMLLPCEAKPKAQAALKATAISLLHSHRNSTPSIMACFFFFFPLFSRYFKQSQLQKKAEKQVSMKSENLLPYLVAFFRSSLRNKDVANTRDTRRTHHLKEFTPWLRKNTSKYWSYPLTSAVLKAQYWPKPWTPTRALFLGASEQPHRKGNRKVKDWKWGKIHQVKWERHSKGRKAWYVRRNERICLKPSQRTTFTHPGIQGSAETKPPRSFATFPRVQHSK